MLLTFILINIKVDLIFLTKGTSTLTGQYMSNKEQAFTTTKAWLTI